MKTDAWEISLKDYIENGKTVEAETLLMELEPEEFGNIKFWICKGQFYQKIQNWSVAINSFNKALELDPGNKTAKSNIEIIQSILNFWNPEMFNA